MKWIVVAGFAGWAAIVRLSWWMADERLHRCENWKWDGNTCVMRALANRDAVLTNGATVALLALLAVAFLFVRNGAWKRWGTASHEGWRKFLP